MVDPLPLAGRYRFGRRFGGPNAAVWLAFDDRTDRQVVVSLVTPSRAAELASSVGVAHVNLASIVEIVERLEPSWLPPGVHADPALSALIAEYVAGETLYAKIERAPLPRAEAVACVAALAGALHALHRHGAAHGAFSPLAVVVARADGRPGPVVTQGLMPGLAEYASPEHHAGAPRSPADDVWALHATLHAALIGRPPPAIGPGRPPPPDLLAREGQRDELLDTILQQGLALSLSARTCTVEDLEESLGLWIARSAARGRRPDSRVDDDAEVPVARGAQPRRRPSSTALAGAGAQRLAELGMGPRPAERAPSVAPPAPRVDLARERADAAALAAVEPPRPDARAATPSTRPTFAPGLDSMPDLALAPAREATPPPPEPPPALDRAPEVEREDEPAPLPREASLDAAVHVEDADRAPVAADDADRADVPAAPRAAARPWGPIGAGALLFAGILGALAITRLRGEAPAPSASPALSSVAARVAPRAPAGPEAAAPSATAPVAAAPSAPEPVGDPSSCLAGAFPAGSFSSPPDLAFVCEDADARSIAKKIHTRLIVAGAGLATPAMKEWAMLEWYELAALAVIRGRCCPAAAPMDLPPAEPCDPLGPTLDRLAQAVSKRADVDLRVLGFDKNVVCLSGQAKRPYRYVGHPYGGGQRVFAQFLARNTR